MFCCRMTLKISAAVWTGMVLMMKHLVKLVLVVKMMEPIVGLMITQDSKVHHGLEKWTGEL